MGTKTNNGKSFKVEVAVTTRESCYDPEGRTIVEQLAHKVGYTDITSIRSGKLIRMDIKSETSEKALESVRALCDDIGYFTSVNNVEIKERSDTSGKQEGLYLVKGNGNVHIVEAIINYRPGVTNSENQPVLAAAESGKHDISNISVSKLLRIWVSAKTPGAAISYVSEFDSKCELHKELLQDIELRNV